MHTKFTGRRSPTRMKKDSGTSQHFWCRPASGRAVPAEPKEPKSPENDLDEEANERACRDTVTMPPLFPHHKTHNTRCLVRHSPYGHPSAKPICPNNGHPGKTPSGPFAQSQVAHPCALALVICSHLFLGIAVSRPKHTTSAQLRGSSKDGCYIYNFKTENSFGVQCTAVMAP